MDFTSYLAREWVVALGCTEPAAIALAAAAAAHQLGSRPESVSITCDGRIYKNCYAVGIPRSGGKTGILWAAAIGAAVADPGLGLTLFSATAKKELSAAQKLIEANRVFVEVDSARADLFIDCTVRSGSDRARAVIEREHANITRLERNGEATFEKPSAAAERSGDVRAAVAAMPLAELIDLARAISPEDRARLQEGMALNRRIAAHGLTLFPERFVQLAARDELSRISTLVCAGVYARMCGEEFPVMTLAGSGNKGITAAVPLALHGEALGREPGRVEEALALACLLTSATTCHLGTLSAVCGCSNAAGIGLSAGLVLLEDGGAKEVSLAINNMVGNVSGMICDGAKIGCALKTMTAVDAAFRAASLALSGLGIPVSDGIVGATGPESLGNLGRIATRGMLSADAEILAIMREKLKS